MAKERSAEEIINQFVEFDTVVIPLGRVLMEVTIEPIHQVLGLNNMGAMELQRAYPIGDEILAKVSMHQVILMLQVSYR